MEFILIIILVFLLLSIVANLTPKPGQLGGAENQLVVQKKKCPPHQWFWQEVVDQDGNKLGERICCKVCGPLRSREENEG
jgi:hypothetical protein